MSEQKPPNNNSFPDDATRVDLGEDLLREVHPHATQTLAMPDLPPAESIESRFESARILKSEGLLEEAKKVLHSNLIQDSGHHPSTNLLKEIHEFELNQIFNQERKRKIFRKHTETEELDLSSIDQDEVLRKLDEDLKLNLSASELPALLKDPKNLEQFANDLEKRLKDSSPQDRIDLGIGFLEMGLATIAASHFAAAARAWEDDSDLRAVSAVSLLALAQMIDGKPFEATLTLQPVINDTEIPAQDKIELFYLMGRAQDALSNPDIAHEWYRKTEVLDPYYRDIQERLRPRKGTREK